ncbi:MAG: glycosyltransferase family 87 protein [Thermoanaerobaculia bacterium]|nr:glycosyltransferase family 87 protein [Thermoanaerobaculia bacterium]
MQQAGDRRTPSSALAAIVVFGLVYGNFLLQYGWRDWQILNVDLPSFHLASHLAFQEGRSPYDRETFLARGPAYDQNIFPFFYPPPSLLLLWPLSWWSYPAAATGFLVVQHLLLVLWLWLVVRFTRAQSGTALPWLIACGLVACYPVLNTFLHGQVNLLTSVLLLTAGLGYRRGRTGLTAFPLAGAILLKQSPVILLILLVLRRRWRALAATVAILAAATLASYALLPAEAWRDWLVEVRPTLGYGRVPQALFAPSCAFNQSVNGAVARFFLPADCGVQQEVPVGGRWLTVLLAAVLGAASLFALARRGSSQKDDPWTNTRDFALFLPLGFLLSPLSWLHHLVIVLPAAVVALRDAFEHGGRLRRWAVVAAALVIGTDVPIVDLAATPYGLGPWLGALPALAVLGLGLALAVPPAREGPAPAG